MHIPNLSSVIKLKLEFFFFNCLGFAGWQQRNVVLPQLSVVEKRWQLCGLGNYLFVEGLHGEKLIG